MVDKNKFKPSKKQCLNFAKNFHQPVEGGNDISIASMFPLVCNQILFLYREVD